jgi:hypothetical protein
LLLRRLCVRAAIRRGSNKSGRNRQGDESNVSFYPGSHASRLRLCGDHSAIARRHHV